MPVVAKKGMVATDHEAASVVGAHMLQQGGDAADAAVAAALMLGVVQPFGSGLGGGGFAVVRRASGQRFVLDFREVAPRKAFRDMFLKQDKTPIPNGSRRGALAAAVPGELAGLYELHRRYGRLPWSAVVSPALTTAEKGFPCGEFLHQKIAEYRQELKARPRLAGLFLTDAGRAKPIGSTIRQPHLANTLRAISQRGVKALYKGPIADELVKAIQAGGGIISHMDLANYRWRERAPLVVNALDATFIGMPPPSSGGAVLGQVLGLIQPARLRAHGHNKSAYVHEIVEYLKHAFADRANIMGDPDFVQIPVEAMLSAKQRHRIQAAFDPRRTLPNAAYGGRYAMPADGGTSHLSVLDQHGNAIALTTTINTTFGSMFMAGETGILMNNEMDDFVIRPGVPNAFGLVGRKANEIAPGKKPLSSMSPTIIVRDGRPLVIVGASGGPTIITGTLQVILNILVFGMNAQAAVSAPRFHHQWQPDLIYLDRSFVQSTVDGLVTRGHRTKFRPRFTAVQVISVTTQGMEGASDPSKLGQPAGVRHDGKIAQP
ncbi:MAG: gamma-glutamyltransferase [Myxococcota bacterium]|nr:gamma-glutamyltransferase [Myxococcota bacterium]